MKFYTGISGKSPSKFELQFSSRTSIRLLYSNLIEFFAACLHPQTTLFLKVSFFSCNVQGHSDVILTVSRSCYYTCWCTEAGTTEVVWTFEAQKKEECVSSCKEFDVIGVKSKGRGSKTCERFVTHNSQLVNDLEYGDDMHANYFSRHSTSPNHRACIPWLDSRRLRSRECWGVTVRSIQLRW